MSILRLMTMRMPQVNTATAGEAMNLEIIVVVAAVVAAIADAEDVVANVDENDDEDVDAATVDVVVKVANMPFEVVVETVAVLVMEKLAYLPSLRDYTKLQPKSCLVLVLLMLLTMMVRPHCYCLDFLSFPMAVEAVACLNLQPCFLLQ